MRRRVLPPVASAAIMAYRSSPWTGSARRHPRLSPSLARLYSLASVILGAAGHWPQRLRRLTHFSRPFLDRRALLSVLATVFGKTRGPLASAYAVQCRALALLRTRGSLGLGRGGRPKQITGLRPCPLRLLRADEVYLQSCGYPSARRPTLQDGSQPSFRGMLLLGGGLPGNYALPVPNLHCPGQVLPRPPALDAALPAILERRTCPGKQGRTPQTPTGRRRLALRDPRRRSWRRHPLSQAAGC